MNFYRVNARKVFRFALLMSFFPAALVSIIAYTPAGPWFLEHIMGLQAGSPLMNESLRALRFFMIMNVVFPWLDYCHGIIMLRGQTRIMVWSQAFNVVVTLVTLFVLVKLVPGWSGSIGALAQSLGLTGEILIVLFILRSTGHTRLGASFGRSL